MNAKILTAPSGQRGALLNARGLVAARNRPQTDDGAVLTVKELAGVLGKSDHYVYQMKACGFPMELRTFPESNIAYLTATERAAREWIAVNDFRLVDGWGVTGGYQFFLPFKLQTESWTVRETMSKSVSQFAA